MPPVDIKCRDRKINNHFWEYLSLTNIFNSARYTTFVRFGAKVYDKRTAYNVKTLGVPSIVTRSLCDFIKYISKTCNIYLHLYFHCFNIHYRTNEVHSSMNTVSLITAQRYGKHLWRQEFPAIFRMLLF